MANLGAGPVVSPPQPPWLGHILGAETEVAQLQTKWLVLVERIEEEGSGRRWEASALAAGETQTDQVPVKGALSQGRYVGPDV